MKLLHVFDMLFCEVEVCVSVFLSQQATQHKSIYLGKACRWNEASDKLGSKKDGDQTKLLTN